MTARIVSAKTPCVFCRRPVIDVGASGTFWIHEDGYRECMSTYAAPDFINDRIIGGRDDDTDPEPERTAA